MNAVCTSRPAGRRSVRRGRSMPPRPQQRPGPHCLIRACLIFTRRGLCINAFASGRRRASTGGFAADPPSAARAPGERPCPSPPCGPPGRRGDGRGDGSAHRGRRQRPFRGCRRGAGAEARWPGPVGSEGGEQPPARSCPAAAAGAQPSGRWEPRLFAGRVLAAGLIYSRSHAAAFALG